MNSSNINFFFEDIEQYHFNTEKVQTWLSNIAKKNSKFITDLNYIFCSDDYLLQVNIDYLNHDYYTDIITFDNSEQEEEIEGDIFISIDRINDNANMLNESFENELLRVLAHGFLHLIGFNDKTEKDQQEMTEQENFSIQEYRSLVNL